MHTDSKKHDTPTDANNALAPVAKDYGIICPNCKTDKGLIWKSYLMFHKRCDWCGANVKLRNHPQFGQR
jgi:uncharacterized protein (DUF983 family)